MNFFAFTGILNAAVAAAPVVAVLLQKKRSPRHLILSLSLISIFVWSLFYALWLFTDDPVHALWYTRLLQMGSSWIPSLFLHHVVLITERWPSHRRFIIFAHTLAAIFCVIAPTSLTVTGVAPRSGFLFWPLPGPALYFQFTFFVLIGAYLIFHLYRALAWTTGLKREQVRYLLLSLAIGWPGGLTNYLLWFNIPVKPWGNPFVIVANGMISYTILKYRLADLTTATRSGLIYTLLACIVLGPMIGLAHGMGAPSCTLAGIALGGLLSPYLFKLGRNRLSRAVDTLPVFQSRVEQFRPLERALAELASAQTIGDWAWKTVGAVLAGFPVKSANLLLREDEFHAFLIRAGIGLSPEESTLLSLPLDHPLTRRLEEARGVLIGEELPEQIEPREQTDIQKQLTFMHSALVAPIFEGNILRAVLNVDEKKDGEMFNEWDLTHMNSLVRVSQQTLHIVLSGLARAQRTATWAHDIARPFGPKGSLGHLRETLDTHKKEVPPGLKPLLDRVVEDAHFVETQIKNLLAPRENAPRAIPSALTEAFQHAAASFQSTAKLAKVSLHCDPPPPDVKVLCDPWLVEYRVLANLVENAIRHTPVGGTVELGHQVRENRLVGFVRDTGEGLRPEDLSQLFRPGVQLDHRRKGLAGLGLLSVQNVVASWDGRVWVDSLPEKGSCFYFDFPLEK